MLKSHRFISIVPVFARTEIDVENVITVMWRQRQSREIQAFEQIGAPCESND